MYRYILAALEEGRHQVQILHEYDSCCFRAASLHDEIKDYNAYVRARVRAHVRLRPALHYYSVEEGGRIVSVFGVEDGRGSVVPAL